ncbi:MAG: efflux RND transporter permease subunit [Gammaproteobacteria bacterium]|nr:efflux RND transporter permease subunit [Gammaproteobacteria bacterium]MBL6999010.1 efflux RND transporter permease subunit [Gammaproteobacteria bacterium]
MINWFAHHPTAANLTMLAIIILGLISLPDLQRETFPRIKVDKVSIQALYPGSTAEDVEDAICRRLEDALESISDLDEMICESSEGFGKATAVMTEGRDMMVFMDDVKSAVDAINDFPELVESPVVTEIGRTDAVISIAITGPENPVILKAYAEDVKLRLLADARIANIEIDGFSDHQIRVEIPANRLRQYGLSLSDIASSMQNQSISTPAGRLENAHEDILLRFDDQRKTVDQVGRLVVISGKTGAAIQLQDIAHISDRFDRDESRIQFNGQRAAILNITKTQSQDILNSLADVKSFVEAENQRVARGIKLSLTQDRASIVQDRLDMILKNGVQGLLAVFAILWLFFSFRYSFWVTMGLPISFLGALFVLPLAGMTINMITLVGLLIGIGLLMDDAIVIAENIAARMEKGERAMQAAVAGVNQVLPGILSSFSTTLLVFGSLAFITGQIGQILSVMPVVLIIVLSVSLIEAFLVLPNHLGHSLKHIENRRESRPRLLFERGFNYFRDNMFGPLLDRAIHYRYLTLGIIIMLIIAAIALPAGGKLKFVGFPATDGDIVEARLLLPQGTPLQLTESIVEQIQQAAYRVDQQLSSQQPQGQKLVNNITIIYGQNPDAYESGPHVARVIVDLLSAEIRSTSIDEFRNAWRQQVGDLADVISLQYTEPAIGPGGRAIEIRLKGDDLHQLKAASMDLQNWFKQYAGVTDISDDLRPGKREFRIRLKQSAGVLGVNASMVAGQIRAAFQGIQIDEFPVGPETYEVDLRLASDAGLSADDLEQLSITGPGGSQIPLLNVVHIEEVRGWARINRVDRHRTITVFGDVQRELANSQELLTLAASEVFVDITQHYPGVKIDTQGESENSAKTGKSIVRNVILGLIGVYILLAFQFRGYMAPFSVMVVIPTALIGVMFGHYFLGLDLTMPSIIGMASLFGVVVNDSILLVIFIREARKQGTPTHVAARQAGRARFRPILLTSITTIAGLTPLLAETSLQAQILIPMAASLAFGLTSSTIAALFLVPALYCILDDFNLLGQLHEEDD